MSFKELFRADSLPVLQNRVFPTAAEAAESPTGDILLAQDLETGLVSNHAFAPEKIVYDENYQNEQACSGAFQRHLEQVEEIIAKHFPKTTEVEGQRAIIEVGCGKGYFLEQLFAKGYDIKGVDPAYEGESEHIIKANFGPELGLFADSIVLRHVLEHIPDPVSFLSMIAEGNGGKGLIYIEVPCFAWIREQQSWFDIFYEHVNYFRLSDFDSMFGNVIESGHVFHGQYIYVVADLASLRKPKLTPSREVQPLDDFLEGVEQAAAKAKEHQRNVIWGASSKGVIFSIYMKRAGIDIDFAIDINPAKQGRYLACSGLEVMSPEEAMKRLEPQDHVFVMNSNYFDEIVEQSSHQYQYSKVDHNQDD